jgi:hypothetical protein
MKGRDDSVSDGNIITKTEKKHMEHKNLENKRNGAWKKN